MAGNTSLLHVNKCVTMTSFVPNLMNPKSTSGLQIPDKIYSWRSMYQNIDLNKTFIKAGSVCKYLHLLFHPCLHHFHLGHPSQVAPWDPWPQVIQGALGSHQAPRDQGDYKRAARCGWWCFGLSWVKRIVTGSRQLTANTTSHTSAAWWSLGRHQKKERIWVSGWSHKVLIQTR